MQALILAAGTGSRLGKHTKENTKCMLSLNGVTLIMQALKKLNNAGITKLILVVGYKKENLIEHVGTKYKNIEIEYVENPIYGKTNNIYSLYLAKDRLAEDDTLLLESDLVFDESISNGESSNESNRYSMLCSSFYMEIQERERALIKLFTPFSPLLDKTIIEIGCGYGGKILQLIQLGFKPQNITANELLPDEVIKAKERLPKLVKIIEGDASKLEFESSSFDFVYQSTVFSSVLDNSFQEKLAKEMWRWVKPGGGILWYDFIYNNPNNKDVRGVPVSRIKELFPDAIITTKRITLAPPINRMVTKIHPSLYTLFNTLPFLRTHVFCFIQKPK